MPRGLSPMKATTLRTFVRISQTRFCRLAHPHFADDVSLMAFLFDAIAKPNHDPTKPGPIKPKWEFTKDELLRSPSVLAGLSFTEEQRLIRYGVTFIRKIADRLNEVQKELPKITQLCVSVSIIQLRRFFTIQCLQSFDARDVGAAILFMTTKSEECPRRLEYIIRAWFKIRHEFDSKNLEANEPVSMNKEAYEKFCEYIDSKKQSNSGFNFEITVPHPSVLTMAQQYRPDDKKFPEAVFWLVTDVLHLTNWCLVHKAKKIAAACFYIASIWKDETPRFPPDSANGETWYTRLDKSITLTELQDMTKEFLLIWKDVDKQVNLSMSQFDHKTPPIVFERFVGSALRPAWHATSS